MVVTTPSKSCTRRAAVTIGAAALAGSMLTGCSAESSPKAPEGWGTLDAKQVEVSYPEGWKPVPPEQEKKPNTTGVTLSKDGAIVARIAVQTSFMWAGDLDMAASGAQATYVLGGGSKDSKDIKLGGVEARRIEYDPRVSNGLDHSPPEGTTLDGTDVVAMDSKDRPFLVRIIRKQGAVSPSDIDKIVESVRVTG
ncbi:hypothetical protein [Streptomyces hiroshimensis]|uniref:Lipoprotein n=1 Tax=Streptomyces hiroshimensis TaxID=66424 RepID=A0ABQ2YQ01_9ACTN|nr:hypothetical protein [Streptomyces hiroshimensis]GGX89542.1 hypothetical protein GCM10010324_38950 [Streptomyces hiroshimensis]